MQRLSVSVVFNVNLTVADLGTLAAAISPVAGPEERSAALKLLFPLLEEAKPWLGDDALLLFKRQEPQRELAEAGFSPGLSEKIARLAPLPSEEEEDARGLVVRDTRPLPRHEEKTPEPPFRGPPGSTLLTCKSCLGSAIAHNAKARGWPAPDLCHLCAGLPEKVREPDDEVAKRQARTEKARAAQRLKAGPFAGRHYNNNATCALCERTIRVRLALKEGWTDPECCPACEAKMLGTPPEVAHANGREALL